MMLLLEMVKFVRVRIFAVMEILWWNLCSLVVVAVVDKHFDGRLVLSTFDIGMD